MRLTAGPSVVACEPSLSALAPSSIERRGRRAGVPRHAGEARARQTPSGSTHACEEPSPSASAKVPCSLPSRVAGQRTHTRRQSTLLLSGSSPRAVSELPEAEARAWGSATPSVSTRRSTSRRASSSVRAGIARSTASSARLSSSADPCLRPKTACTRKSSVESEKGCVKVPCPPQSTTHNRRPPPMPSPASRRACDAAPPAPGPSNDLSSSSSSSASAPGPGASSPPKTAGRRAGVARGSSTPQGRLPRLAPSRRPGLARAPRSMPPADPAAWALPSSSSRVGRSDIVCTTTEVKKSTKPTEKSSDAPSSSR
mmetsp:Transcript_11348/g.28746  ORF Transcript_11348/g.28746 Transcript_11348/m.28746 type:complete len:313 (+) Transcript_11348:587-1525(+)